MKTQALLNKKFLTEIEYKELRKDRDFMKYYDSNYMYNKRQGMYERIL